MRSFAFSALLTALGLLVACAGPPAAPRASTPGPRATGPLQGAAVRTALAQVGAPYRHGGSSPRGFDCSGLVVYSFSQAGATGLPRTAAALERRSRPIPVGELRPGDLLFFRFGGSRTSHVALYVGDGAFVHAPSSGKRVERVRFDHVYWGPRVRRAGRLEL